MSDKRRSSGNRVLSNSRPDDEKLTVRVSAALLSRVDHAALERGVGRSEFVRRALVMQADAVLGESPSGDRPTLFDLLGADGVIGRFAGPRGLSTTDRATIRERVRKHLRTAGSPAGEPAETPRTTGKNVRNMRNAKTAR